MFRAIRPPIAAALVLVLLVLSYCYRGAGAEQSLMNGIGLVDYGKPPDFKVGTFVSYASVQTTRGISEPGQVVTLLVPAEERFWGDDCFWLETRDGEDVVLSLMSYAIFQDSFPSYRLGFYTRKSILGMDDQGNLDEQISQIPPAMLKSREPLPSADRDITTRLGMDTVITPIGTFSCEKVETKRGTGTTKDVGDSTTYTEEYDVTTSYMTPKIPLTHLARQDVEVTISKKTWRIGHSASGEPMQQMLHSSVSARAIGFGQGMKSDTFPLERQKSLQQLSAASTPATPAAKKTTPTKAPKPGTAR